MRPEKGARGHLSLHEPLSGGSLQLKHSALSSDGALWFAESGAVLTLYFQVRMRACAGSVCL